MESYIITIKWAFLFFPILAAIITFPYILYQYRKFGAIPAIRTILLYSFVLYLLVAYFLVILPLPPIDEVAKYTSPTMQLIPFYFIGDIIKSIPNITGFSSFLTFLGDSSIYNVLFNILLFLPFGIYLRYYFQYSFKKSLLACLLLTLFFELTQLSGLYGIYPRPYRLFDVDDLIMNTLGGMIGFWITPFISRFLPKKETIDEKAYKMGTQVKFLRRMIAFGFDFLIILILQQCLSISYFLIVILYFGILLPLTGGKTIGKMIVRIRIGTEEEGKGSIFQYIFRIFLLYIVYLPAPFSVLLLVSNLPNETIVKWMFILVAILLMIFYCVMSIQILISIFSPKVKVLHETMSHTKNISTIPFPKDNLMEEEYVKQEEIIPTEKDIIE